MGGRSVKGVKLNGKIWINEISVVSLFNFFVVAVIFIINIFFP